MAKPRICSTDCNGKKVRVRIKPLCRAEACSTSVWKGGYCKLHFRRNEKFGNPLADPGPTPIQKFIQNAIACQEKDCLIWPFAMPKGTYAKVHIKINGKCLLAPRYICTQVHGAPPTPKHEAAHSCGNGARACMNGSHLRWATKEKNQADRLIHGTDLRGTKSIGAILTEGDVIVVRKLLESGHSEYFIAKQFSVSRSCIASIKHRRAWGWLD